MPIVIYLLLIFPVFSLTSLIGFARIHNVAIAILLIGVFELALKKTIKLNPTLIYCWFIAFGMGSSIALRLIFEGQSNVSEWVFPLIWILLPFFLSYWKRYCRKFPSNVANFTDYFFLINFIYAFIQIIASRIFGYSLMIHRLFSDYQILNFAQDTPFSYLGLNSIHQFISENFGSPATGLVIERIDLMFLCIICILRINPFSYKSNLKYKSKNHLLSHINIILAIILLSICGSSLSIFIILLPFLCLITCFDTKLSFRIIRLKISKLQKALALTVLFTVVILCSLFYFFYLFSEIVGVFDMSGRIMALHKFSFILTDFSSHFSQFLYGSGVITAANLEIGNLGNNDSLLPRSLDVFGYAFNSFGLLGLVPFLSGYPLLLHSQTSLKWASIFVFCSLVFTGVGSPLSYIYTYALILSSPNDISVKEYTTESKISHV